jgi:Bacterial Ig-like domain
MKESTMKQQHNPIQRQFRWQVQRRPILRRARLQLEQLEDRTLPSSTIIEGFEPGSLAAYQAAIRNDPGYSLTAEILPIAAHDGSNGLVKQDDYDWLIRNDGGSQVHQGDTVSVWIKLADVADGRAYLGFDAKNTGPTFSRMNQSGAVSVVMAPNTNQLMIEVQSGSNGIASFSTVGSAVAQTYQADQWYRLEATWGTGGAMTGRLYDSDGTTLLNTVSGTTTAPFPSGAGIAFRAFGHDKYFDTVVLDAGSTDTPDQRVAVDPGLDAGWTAGNPPAPVGNNPTGGPAPVPWDYASKPGTGIEIQLASFNQLQQAPAPGIVGGVVGLAAGNLSLNTGTVQVGWGEPIETPLLAQYMFRQRPGEATQLVGASSVKHFFSTVSADFQHLNAGESDPYGASLNTQQSQYTFGSELDPVTGTLHSQVGRGHINNDGMQVLDSRTFPDHIQYLLQVNVADLDPAQNPVGTRWFLMGNLFVDGEQDVTQASRWVEVVPAFNGTTFSFSYPGGSGGHLDFRTIPGLVAAGFVVTSSSPTGNLIVPVDHVHVVFNQSVDVTTFTPDQVNFVDPSGAPITITSVTEVGSTDQTQFDISFATQGIVGNYALTLSSDILDLAGDNLAGFTNRFTIISPAVIATNPGAGSVAAPFNHVTVTFDRPMDPTTVTSANITLTGPGGAIPLTIGTGATQFDVTFDDQTASGAYTLAISTGVQDTYANPITPFSRQFTILPTGSNLVANGGFENPIGSEWTIVDPSGYTARVAANPHSGTYAMELGATGADGTITQTLNTVAGQSYTFSFWYFRDGGTPSDLHVFWNGVDTYDEVNSAAHGYVQHTFTVTATGASTQIQFAARNDPGFDYLDDVSVIAN